MKFNELTKVLFSMWQSKIHQTVLLLGAPGIGKTAASKILADLMTQHVRETNSKAAPALCEVLDLSSMMPEDLAGLPRIVGETEKDIRTVYAPQDWMFRLSQPDAYGVLVLDDLPAASGAVQVAARQLSLDRRIHQTKISDNVIIIVTGNRREDKSAATTLPAHFRNSCLMLQIEPDFDTWSQWYGEQALDGLIPAFLLLKPGHFSRLPKDADSQGAFATPRTWAMLGKIAGTARTQQSLFPIAAGLVGEGVATELLGFEKIRAELVSPKEILANPQQAFPNMDNHKHMPDRMIAIVTSISEYAAKIDRELPKNTKKRPHVNEYAKALAYVTQHNSDLVNMALNVYFNNGGEKSHLLHEIISLRKTDTYVDRMLTILRKSLISEN